ncbi:MAG TPA: fluoride efflux transporter CrcB [Burkholderiales bacterium]|nr:fluoride efflux transporter CrcB [Burkholderiales bacterium]
MKAVLLVALGGALGSMARYKVSGWVLHHTMDWKFPAGTFAVNVAGCLIAGLLAGLAEKHEMLSADARLLLFTGLLGGFTTFSAFGLETMHLLRKGELLVAGSNVALSVAAGLLALWLALRLGLGAARA